MANCTRLRLVKLPSNFLVQLFPNYTQKHVITYTNTDPSLLFPLYFHVSQFFFTFALILGVFNCVFVCVCLLLLVCVCVCMCVCMCVCVCVYKNKNNLISELFRENKHCQYLAETPATQCCLS